MKSAIVEFLSFSDEDFTAALLVLGPEPPARKLVWGDSVAFPVAVDVLNAADRVTYWDEVRSWAIARYGDNAMADHFRPQFERWQAGLRAADRRVECLRKQNLPKR